MQIGQPPTHQAKWKDNAFRWKDNAFSPPPALLKGSFCHKQIQNPFKLLEVISSFVPGYLSVGIPFFSVLRNWLVETQAEDWWVGAPISICFHALLHSSYFSFCSFDWKRGQKGNLEKDVCAELEYWRINLVHCWQDLRRKNLVHCWQEYGIWQDSGIKAFGAGPAQSMFVVLHSATSVQRNGK